MSLLSRTIGRGGNKGNSGIWKNRVEGKHCWKFYRTVPTLSTQVITASVPIKLSYSNIFSSICNVDRSKSSPMKKESTNSILYGNRQSYSCRSSDYRLYSTSSSVLQGGSRVTEQWKIDLNEAVKLKFSGKLQDAADLLDKTFRNVLVDSKKDPKQREYQAQSRAASLLLSLYSVTVNELSQPQKVLDMEPALKDLAKRFNDDELLALVAYSVGNAYTQSGKPELAEKNFLFALDLIEKLYVRLEPIIQGSSGLQRQQMVRRKLHMQNTIEYPSLSEIGFLYLQSNQLEKALTYTKRALAIASLQRETPVGAPEQLVGSDAAQRSVAYQESISLLNIVESQNQYAAILFQQGKLNEARMEYEKAFNTISQNESKEDLTQSKSQTLYGLATIYLANSQFKEAITCYQEYFSILKTIKSPPTVQEAGAMIESGIAYYNLKDFEKAKNQFTRGKSLAKRFQLEHLVKEADNFLRTLEAPPSNTTPNANQ